MRTEVGRSSIDVAVARLDRWLDSMRGPDGYVGPVVHWWQDCLAFCGAGLDWRYEGIIAGYLSLHDRTKEQRWLEKARRAGDDLLRGQDADGHFRHSGFELNPKLGGTPHEAAADLALLMLARTLRDRGDEEWQAYLSAAETNLQEYYVRRLWCVDEQRFRDDPLASTFVPNKAATLIEALCALADLRGRDEDLDRYVRPTADAILALQIRSPRHSLNGAIAQNSLRAQVVEKYFPYYNARCVPGLVAAYEHLGHERYLTAAVDAMSFVYRSRDLDGGLPQVIYPDGHVNRYPRWIAGLGDVLCAAELLGRYGSFFPKGLTLQWLLQAQLPTGAFAVADGFASQVSQSEPSELSDARDLFPVVGWNDKIFRYLATQSEDIPDLGVAPYRFERPCLWLGRRAVLHQDEEDLCISVAGSSRMPLYRWRKTAQWAEVVSR